MKPHTDTTQPASRNRKARPTKPPSSNTLRPEPPLSHSLTGNSAPKSSNPPRPMTKPAAPTVNPEPQTSWRYATTTPAVAELLDQIRSKTVTGPKTVVMTFPYYDDIAIKLDREEPDMFEHYERSQRLIANPPIGAIAGPSGRFIFVGEHRHAIDALGLRKALGFKGSEDEFMQLVDQTEQNCLRISVEFCAAMVPLHVARKIAMGLGGAQAACVAYQLAEIMCRGYYGQFFNFGSIVTIGNPYCPPDEPLLLSPGSRAVHWFLLPDTDYDSWWLKRRKNLDPMFSREPADVDLDLPLPVALRLLASEPNARGRRVRDYLGNAPGWDEWPATLGHLEYWYKLLNKVAGAEIPRFRDAPERSIS